MAVTTNQIAVALRILGAETDALDAAISAILTRQAAVGRALVTAWAPTAPTDAADEAVIRLTAFLYDQDPALPRSSNPMVASGAGSILAPWHVQRLEGAGPDAAGGGTVLAPGVVVTAVTLSGRTLTVTKSDDSTLELELPAGGMGGGGLSDAQLETLQHAVQIDGISFSGDNLSFASDGGQSYSVNLDQRLVPSITSGDANKVLKVDASGTTADWRDDETASGGSGLDRAAVDARVNALVPVRFRVPNVGAGDVGRILTAPQAAGGQPTWNSNPGQTAAQVLAAIRANAGSGGGSAELQARVGVLEAFEAALRTETVIFNGSLKVAVTGAAGALGTGTVLPDGEPDEFLLVEVDSHTRQIITIEDIRKATGGATLSAANAVERTFGDVKWWFASARQLVAGRMEDTIRAAADTVGTYTVKVTDSRIVLNDDLVWAQALAGNRTRWPESKLPEKVDDLADALSTGGGWQAAGAVQATSPWISDRFYPVAPTSISGGLTFVQSVLIHPRQTNTHLVIRVPKTLPLARLQLVVGYAPTFPPIPASAWTELYSPNIGLYDYYVADVPDTAVGDTARVEVYQPFVLDPNLITVPSQAGRFTTRLADSQAVPVAILSTAPARGALAAFATEALTLSGSTHGVILVSIEWALAGTAEAYIRLGDDVMDDAEVFLSELRASTAYAGTVVQGIQIGEVDIHTPSGTVPSTTAARGAKIGTVTAYVARNAANQVGVYASWTALPGSPQPAPSGTVQARVTAVLLRTDAPAAAAPAEPGLNQAAVDARVNALVPQALTGVSRNTATNSLSFTRKTGGTLTLLLGTQLTGVSISGQTLTFTRSGTNADVPITLPGAAARSPNALFSNVRLTGTASVVLTDPTKSGRPPREFPVNGLLYLYSNWSHETWPFGIYPIGTNRRAAWSTDAASVRFELENTNGDKIRIYNVADVVGGTTTQLRVARVSGRATIILAGYLV